MLEKNEKIKNIAISSYLLILISWALLLNKDNPNTKNSFVKSHIKIAFLIHILMLLTYILFITKWYFNFYQFFNFNSNQIIATVLFIWLFASLLFWMYKAFLWEEIEIKSFTQKRKNKIVNLEEDIKITEKWIFSIILTYIPFIWFLNAWRIRKGSFLNILKFNTYITLFLIILYIFWANSSANFIILAYIIFVVFTAIMLIINKTFIKIDLSFLPSFGEISDYIKIFFIYLKNYFWNNFKTINIVKREFIEKKLIIEKQENDNLENIEKSNNFLDKINKKIIYFPIINLIFLFFLKTKYKTHIINGLFLTLFTIIFIFLDLNKKFYLDSNYYLFIIFWIFYWIWNLNIINYKFPFFYDIYETIIFVKNKIKKLFWKVKEKHNEEHEINLKVKK